MTVDNELILTRDTTATIIPAGEEQVLKAGTSAVISQALGGTVTIRTDHGLFRLAAKDWDALGQSAVNALNANVKTDKAAESSAPFSEASVWDAMKQCYDPEIPVNIVDLGLIYDLFLSSPNAEGKYKANIKMTLTAQGCGMGPVIADDARQRIEALDAIESAQVDIIWDPPWTPHMISAEGRLKLGLD